MKIGSVKEIKKYEYRVGLTPDNVKSYVNAGHQVYIERNAGVGSGFMTEDYVKAGAIILESAKEVWATADMIVKVKEPLPDEYPLFRKGQIIYTYLHLAADRALTDAMLAAGVSGVAYETLEDRGYLPLLAPMSQIARQTECAGRCKISGEIVWWFRCIAFGCTRNAKSKSCHPWWRKRWNQCVQDCCGHGCGCYHHGYQHPPTGISG